MSSDYIRQRAEIYNEFTPTPVKEGEGLLNTMIDIMPVPLHLPGYNYAGPGTPLDDYLERGVKPVNKLDEHAMEHDKRYAESSDIEKRHAADEILQEQAWKRFKAADSSLGEKANAWIVTTAMRAKRAMGAGVSKTKYFEYHANLDEINIEKLRTAIEKKKGVTLTLRCDRTKESIIGDTRIPLSAKQIRNVKSKHSENQNATVRLIKMQIKNLSEIEGGFLPPVEDDAAKGEGVYINKKPVEKAAAAKGDGVYINKKPVSGEGARSQKKTSSKTTAKKNSSTIVNGLFQELMKKKKLL